MQDLSPWQKQAFDDLRNFLIKLEVLPQPKYFKLHADVLKLINELWDNNE